MHDWTRRAVSVDWGNGVACVEFDTPTVRALLQAHGLQSLHIPRAEPWGASVSVNETHGPTEPEGGVVRFSIQMQSGDLIELVSRSFDIPASLSPHHQVHKS
jgi:hypothetical protein